MLKIIAVLGLVSGLSVVPSVRALEHPTTMKVCLVDMEVPPWIVNDGEGLAQIFVREVMKRQGVAVTFERMPARRCYVDIQKGDSDIALGSYAADRGAYPMLGDQPDPRRRITVLSYSLFRAKGASVAFDGKVISGLTQPVAVPQGSSVGDLMRQMQVPVDETARLPDQLLRKLLLGRVGAVAMLTETGDMRINTPEFAGKLEKLDPPLVARPYYLILSKKFVANYPVLAEQIWETAALVRESAAFRKKYDEAH